MLVRLVKSEGDEVKVTPPIIKNSEIYFRYLKKGYKVAKTDKKVPSKNFRTIEK
jgi:hypothetical protein